MVDYFSQSKKHLVATLALFLILTSNFWTQNTFRIDWNQNFSYLNERIPNFENVSYVKGLPLASENIFGLPYGDYEVQLNIEESAPLDEFEKLFFESRNYSGEINFEYKFIQTKKDLELHFSFIPVFKDGSILKKVTKYNVSTNKIGDFLVTNLNKSYATNSVLSTGTWIKVAVATNGVYKLDKSFFESVGLDISNINPTHVNVYGNHMGKLNESLAQNYVDDLQKNAILAVGENDGQFNDNDYFIFYATGPHVWKRSGNNFSRTQNSYSDEAYYYVHIDQSDLPKRILIDDGNSLTSNQSTSSYNYFNIYELESNSLVKGGQRWYGELFDGFLTQTVTVPNANVITGAPLKISVAAASNCRTAGNSMNFTLNNTNVGVLNFTQVSEDYFRNETIFNTTNPSGLFNFTCTFNRNSPSFKAYLDYIQIETRASLNASSFLQFRDLNTVGAGNITNFNLSNYNSSTQVWDISNPRNALGIAFNNSTGSFIQRTDTLREFIAFSPNACPRPTFKNFVENQNLHATAATDYIIVTHPSFLGEAERLSAIHSNNGTSTKVITIQSLYDEFGGGNPDPSAIRHFMRMLYKRANGNVDLQPKNLLLFGDVSYDPKNRIANNNYFVPTYETMESENHISALVSDDFFALIDDNASFSGSDQLRFGVGRFAVSTLSDAALQVDKTNRYLNETAVLSNLGANGCCATENSSTFGPWRNYYTIITDDEEGGYFINVDSEPAYDNVLLEHPEMICEKIYSDAFTQVVLAGGGRYPEANKAINNRISQGSLVVNYIGHGGEVQGAEEELLTIPMVNEWTNVNRLPLFVTATCEMGKFDDPSRTSLGEYLNLNPNGGSIALATTSRSVYFGVNSNIIEAFYENVFDRETNGNGKSFGEIMRITKNTSDNSDNKRSFNFLGDPNLRLVLPDVQIVIDSINGKLTSAMDTVRALSVMKIAGHVEDLNGNLMNNFNGFYNPTIFDKLNNLKTLGNDPQSPQIPFQAKKSQLYNGKISITNGEFSFEFVVPKDINYSYGRGFIHSYGNNGTIDANGVDSSFILGGIDPNGLNDTQGPEIEIFMNTENFVDGGLTSPNPLLIVKSFDENGLNTTGNGVGHDLIAVLDNESANPILLNQFYVSDLDTYKSGRIEYNLQGLSEGEHTLKVKLWDVNNNSNEESIRFIVKEDGTTSISNVLNYPNPFTTKTKFFFEHNQSCNFLEVQVRILSVSGKLVKTINETVATRGFNIEGVEWDGHDDFGDLLAKGVYIYTISANLPSGEKVEKTEKLVLLR